MLRRAPVLIVEDEPFIALALAASVEEADGVVVGPAGSVREAKALIGNQPVAAAILDVHLSDRDVTPVAECLMARGVPFIIQTGVGLPAELGERYPALPVYIKPAAPEILVQKLAELMQQSR